MDPSQGSTPVLRAARPLVSVEAFHAIVWTGFAVCTLAFSLRLYIRWLSFRKLLADDYLMIVALLLLCAVAATGQMVLQNIYNMVAAGFGEYVPGPDFLTETRRGLLGFGVQSLFCYAGLWIIKFSFLIFFYRLGHMLTEYLIFWYVVLIANIGGLAAVIGIMQFSCMFGPIEDIMTVCSTPQSFQRTYDTFIASVCVDCITDALILSFPVAILWGVRISLRKKILLSAIFGLVALTIAVTIIRGSVFGGVYKSIREDNMEAMNVTWIWFWFNIEFIVAFLVACLVAFRALFTGKTSRLTPTEKANQSQPSPGIRGIPGRLRNFHNSLLDTFRTFEGSNAQMSLLPRPPAATMTVDFSQGNTAEEWTKPSTGTNRSADDRSISARSYNGANAV